MDVNNLKEGIRLVSEGMAKFAGGPWDYYLKKLVAGYDALCTKYCPFPVGTNVMLTKTPNINPIDSWGWLGSKHFLVAGAEAYVARVEYHEDGFAFWLEFAAESWINSTTKEVNPTPRKHQFCFREDYLARVSEAGPKNRKSCIDRMQGTAEYERLREAGRKVTWYDTRVEEMPVEDLYAMIGQLLESSRRDHEQHMKDLDAFTLGGPR